MAPRWQTRGSYVAATGLLHKRFGWIESRSLDSDRTARIARGFSFRGQAEEGRRSAADGDEAHRRRDLPMRMARRLAKRNEVRMASLMISSDGDGVNGKRVGGKGVSRRDLRWT